MVRVAMRLRLGVTLCHPLVCQHCHKQVDHQGLHGLSCRKSQGSHLRDAAINDIIRRSLTSVVVPSHLEPNGKRLDGATVMPRKTGRILVWDATCPDTYASSHTSLETREAGAVVAQAEQRKRAKYTATSGNGDNRCLWLRGSSVPLCSGTSPEVSNRGAMFP